MNYVTDTHSLAWYFTEDTRLSKRAFQAFEGTIKEGIIIVPAVVLAEIMYIANKGRISLTFEKTLDRIRGYENFDIAPLDADILKEANKIKVNLEMHDKLIVATALFFKVALVTKDKEIRDAGICPIIW